MKRSSFLRNASPRQRLHGAVLLGFCLTVLMTLALPSAARTADFFAVSATLPDQVLRLHILANSDSDGDQVLKLCVRDAVLEQCGELFSPAQNRQEAESQARAALDQLRQTAQAEVRRQGYDYPVTASLVKMYFPTRQYETFTLPAGRYEAVRLVIGSGQGHNWWCMLFPQLCLPAAQEQPPSDGDFTPQQWELLSRDPRYEPRFALVEWYQAARERLWGGDTVLAVSLPDEKTPQNAVSSLDKGERDGYNQEVRGDEKTNPAPSPSPEKEAPAESLRRNQQESHLGASQ